MARLARAVVPELPHHVAQRGNRRQQTFFHPADHALYVALLAEHCRARGVAVGPGASCPTTSSSSSCRPRLGRSRRRWVRHTGATTRHVNRREGWHGYLWQGRFASCALDEAHLLAAARYIELNPVRARLASRAKDWPWSSARARLTGADDGLTDPSPLLALVQKWAAFLDDEPPAGVVEALRAGERTGRPLGSREFVAGLEARLGRRLRPGRPGPRKVDTPGEG